MALKDMKDAVLSKAEAEAQTIVDGAKRRADARWEHESVQLRAEHEHRVEAMKARLEDEVQRRINAAEADYRTRILQLKNDILEDVFDQAAERIRNLPDDGYRVWLKAQLEAVPAIDGARVVAAESDRDLIARLFGQLGSGSSLVLAEETAPIRGGFLVRTEKVDFDFSIEALLGALRERISEEIAAELFGGAEA